MRLGINTFLFVSPFTTDSVKLFPKFKKWGFQTIEIPVEDPSHIDPAAVKKALDKNGLRYAWPTLVLCAVISTAGLLWLARQGRSHRASSVSRRLIPDDLVPHQA